MSKVLITGGGAAGMAAAVFAAENGNQVELFEKNDRLGRKLFITGKGRCNLSNACDMDTLFSSVVTNPKFLYSSFYGFTNQDAMDFFREAGLELKTERGNRVFPVSDHASDVIRTLEEKMKSLSVRVHTCATVKKVACRDGQFSHLVLADGRQIKGDACIVATGGVSYPATGSTGDGYRFAKEAGHTVEKAEPSLVPMETSDAFVPLLQGLSLRNTGLAVLAGEKELYRDFGEMLFTHYGVSGPMVLSASAHVGHRLAAGEPLRMVLDLKPALTEEQLDERILREFSANQNRQFKNAVSGLFPAKLTPVMVDLSGISPEKKVNTVTREERRHFARLIKHLELHPVRLRDFREAIITRGGVSVKEINPATMESRLVSGLYFAGEVLDVDAVTGGFNLQIAWSTAHAAGSSIW